MVEPDALRYLAPAFFPPVLAKLTGRNTNVFSDSSLGIASQWGFQTAAASLNMSFSSDFLKKSCAVIEALDPREIEAAVRILSALKEREGRLFIAGSGGGAGHASHATADFRKLCNIEAYAPYDNVPELTARVNDDGWESTLVDWLKVSRLSTCDCLLLFSVGGGDSKRRISTNLVKAAQYARQMGAAVVGIVGRDGGAIAAASTAAVLIPSIDENLVTPLTEGVQSLVWHLLAFHPALQANSAKWESELNA